MKALQAQTLRSYVDSGSLNISDAVKIMRQLAELVEAAHRNGVAHCGIRPSKVILTRGGQGHLQPRLANIGAGYAEEQTLAGDDETFPAGSLRDAVRYMSPEECQGQTPDERSDVYSLGIVFYEMLVGHPPFEGETPVAIARKHIEEMPSLKDLRIGDLQPITPLVMHLLNKNPAARPSAHELVRNLRYLEYLTPSASQTTLDDAAQRTDSQISSPILVERAPLSDAVGGAHEHEATTFAPAGIVANSFSSNSTSSPESPVERMDASVDETTEEIEETTGEVEEHTAEVEEVSEGVEQDVGVSAAPRELLYVTPLQTGASIQPHNYAPVVEASRNEAARREPERSFSPTPIRVTVPDAQSAKRHTSAKRAYLLLGAAMMLALTLGAFWFFSQRPSTESATGEETANQSLSNSSSTSESAMPPPIASETVSSETLEPTNEGSAPSVRSTDEASILRSTNPAEARTALRGNLNAWVAATNARDIDRQMAFYMPRLTAYYRERNVSRASVRTEKVRLLRRATSFNVQVNDPEITFSSGGRAAIMRFRKRYLTGGRGGDRRGEVIQELRWVMTDEGWKISSERDVQVISNRRA